MEFLSALDLLTCEVVFLITITKKAPVNTSNALFALPTHFSELNCQEKCGSRTIWIKLIAIGIYVDFMLKYEN